MKTRFEDEVVRQARTRADELRSMGFLSAADELDIVAGTLEAVTDDEVRDGESREHEDLRGGEGPHAGDDRRAWEDRMDRFRDMAPSEPAA